jgi:uncharacterized membrane protein HdeD (DUF308 family)
MNGGPLQLVGIYRLFAQLRAKKSRSAINELLIGIIGILLHGIAGRWVQKIFTDNQ